MHNDGIVYNMEWLKLVPQSQVAVEAVGLTLLHSEQPNLHRVLAILSAIRLKAHCILSRSRAYGRQLSLPYPSLI